MSIIDGEAEEALADWADDFEDGTLTVPGAKTTNNQGGFTTGSPTAHSCKALVTDYTDYRRLSLGIPGSDRQVLVLGASLPAGIIPAKGHSITAPDPAKGGADRTFEVIAISGDPASAVYRLQGR